MVTLAARRIPELFYRAVCLFLTIFVLWNTSHPLDPLEERSLFVGLLVLIVYLQSFLRTDRSAWLRTTDLTLGAATVVAYGYIFVNAEAIEAMVLSVPTVAIALGFLAIFLMLEATRRTLGWSLPILVGAFLVYIYYGQHLPYWLAGHMGFGAERIMINLYLSDLGMFGSIAHVMLKYVILFFLFGKLLEWTGALQFIMKLALALMGRFRGGPAMVAVVSSGLVGTVSGSVVANVMITGTMTIPLMKRVGFEPHVAGGVEAAASSGGQFMPPVMGATAFLIAQFLGIPYLEVIKAAFVPAVLYFMAVLIAVYVYSVRSNLKPMPPEEIPSWREVFGGGPGITFLVFMATLVTLLIMRYSAAFSVLYSMAAGLVIYVVIKLLRREPINVLSFVDMASTAPAGFAGLGASAAGVGMIVAVLLLTGLAGRFATVILNLAGQNVVLILILTMLAGLLMGAGMPTTVIYILQALVLAPALVKLGILPLAAHLFIFYGGIMSMVTPPVALAAYAGATIAGSDFWRTGVMGFVFSLSAYILPFVWVFDNGLLLMGSPGQILFAIFTGAVGVTLLGIALVGRAKDKLEVLERAVLFVAALTMLLPIPGSTPVALALALLGLWRPVRRYWLQRNTRSLGHVGS